MNSNFKRTKMLALAMKGVSHPQLSSYFHVIQAEAEDQAPFYL